jgi:hypothetical protein
MKVYFFSIEVTYAECEKLYSSSSNSAVLTADSGERVQLPIVNLRPYVDRQGLNGRFRLIIDDKNKVKSFNKINSHHG